MQADLDEQDARGLLRRPVVLDSPAGAKVTVDGREVLCLCSNDYLNLANDPAVRAAAEDAIRKWGVGAAASRLVSGTMGPHVQLEEALAGFKGTASAVVTPTGWMANHAAVTALADKGDLILCDKLNHASIWNAARTSGARLRTFPHRSIARLSALLERHRAKHRRCLIVTDSLFSMDGDLAPLREIVELKNRYDAQLLIDEAHATGVMGSSGRGVAELLEVEQAVDATVGTLSKGLGALGGFVAGPKALIDTIRNSARAYVYTTGLPPAICAAALESLRIIQAEPQRREKLLQLAEAFRGELVEASLDTRDSASQIIPIVIGEPSDARRISKRLLQEGFLIPAICPPTIPPGTSRLRISLSCGHEGQELTRLLKALKALLR